MSARTVGQRLLSFVLVLTVLGLPVWAQGDAEIASRTGLDADLFATLDVEVSGVELVVTLVYINERAFDSDISAGLRAKLLPYLNRNALYVVAMLEQESYSFDFSPIEISIVQSGVDTFFPNAEDWAEITPGFLSGRFEVNPWSYGSGSAGVLAMGDRIDASEPFTVAYRGGQALFDIVGPGAVAVSPLAPSASQPGGGLDIPMPETIGELEEALIQGEFRSAVVASILDLDPSLVGTVVLREGEEELRLLLVRLESGVEEGALSDELLAGLEPLVGRGAVMLWALSPTGAYFSPWKLHVIQSGIVYDFWFDTSFIELTDGFLRVGRVEPGQVVAGVILLHQRVDPQGALSIYYQDRVSVTVFPSL